MDKEKPLGEYKVTPSGMEREYEQSISRNSGRSKA